MLLGLIRQEILSGISSELRFNKLKLALQDFIDLEMRTEIHEKAAEYFNICRRNGIQG